MINLTVELNFQKLADSLNITKDRFHYKVWQVVGKIAYQIEALAKRAAPRNLSLYPIKHPERRVTGRLRSSIRAVDMGGGNNIVEWHIGTNVPYAAVQEFGRKDGKMGAKLFMAKSYRKGISRLPDRLARIVRGDE